MAKSKLARRVRKLRNLKGTYFCLNVVNAQHLEALKKAHVKAGFTLDFDERYTNWSRIYDATYWAHNKQLYMISYHNAKYTGVYNHDGGAQCVTL